MPRFAALEPVTDADLEVNVDQFSRKRKFCSISSTSSPSSSSTDRNENTRPLDDYLAMKRTNPVKYCPKRRPATQEVPAPAITQPRTVITKTEDDDKLKNFLANRPHFRKERLPEATESKDMKVLRAYRRQEYLAAQEAKKTGGYKEEPKSKKKRASKPFWQKK